MLLDMLSIGTDGFSGEDTNHICHFAISDDLQTFLRYKKVALRALPMKNENSHKAIKYYDFINFNLDVCGKTIEMQPVLPDTMLL